MSIFRKKDREAPLFGHSPGDFGVIAIALLLTSAGLYLCFVSFHVPKPVPAKPSSEVSVSIAPVKSVHPVP
jgi:hypothetical protein